VQAFRWILCFLTGIIEIVKKGIDTFDSFLRLKSIVDNKIQELRSRVPKAMRVLDYLCQKPVINAQKVAEVSKLSLPSAYKLIEDLERLKILYEITGSERDQAFIFRDYLDLFRK
jgi:Fic family protein